MTNAKVLAVTHVIVSRRQPVRRCCHHRCNIGSRLHGHVTDTATHVLIKVVLLTHGFLLVFSRKPKSHITHELTPVIKRGSGGYTSGSK